ncbi:MAG: heat-inducible transcription repressor HrcA [Oscillospiraceae bacterium]|nr:heat-inducible transcription repressor HrcA [Oscillospiraceae bacterium]
MELTERKRQILRSVVDSYIQTAEPVGSKAIADELGLSSATIRNEMADLENMGLIEKPHTSAGRIPSPKGYRLYVDELMRDYRLSVEETEKMNSALSEKMNELDKVIDQAGKIVSKLTLLPSYSLSTVRAPRVAVKRFEVIFVDSQSFILVVMTTLEQVKNKLIKVPFPISAAQMPVLSDVLNTHFTGLTMGEITQDIIQSAVLSSGAAGALIALVLEFVSEVLSTQAHGQYHLAGEGNILNHPEYQDPGKARELLTYLNEAGTDALAMPEDGSKVKILIGPENIAEELKDTSVIMASYNIGDGMQGVIGVVGPTRMDYAKVAARLSYFAEGLNRMFGGPQTPPALESPKKEDKDL